jgi:NADH dehydrogenase FAD-containing subunit
VVVVVVQDGFYFYRFTEKKKVVILGGGFAGSKVAKKLQATFDVTLVDAKDHFVCLISLPSCVCDTAHLSKVTSRHTSVCFLCLITREVCVL